MEVNLWLVRAQVSVCTMCTLAVLLSSLEDSHLPGAWAQLTDGARVNSCGGQPFLDRHGHAAYLGVGDTPSGHSRQVDVESTTDGLTCKRSEESLASTPVLMQNEATLTRPELEQARSRDVTRTKGDTIKNINATKKKDNGKKKYKGSKKQRKKNKKKKMGKKKKRG